MTTLSFDSVTRRYLDGDQEVTALDSLSLNVNSGEFVAVMGPSGSGKSTLLNLAGGLDTPTSGRVCVQGSDLAGLSVGELARIRRRHVGYIFQKLNLMPTLTALENVMLPMELDGAGDAKLAAQDALNIVGLSDRGSHYPDQLSGGQQQRVAVARAIVGTRSLILADEPTGALDTANGEAVMELLARQCEVGRAVVLVTHEPRFASYADRIVNLRDGQIVHPDARVTVGAV
jgi:putative ABC transport system ATP-binding protein